MGDSRRQCKSLTVYFLPRMHTSSDRQHSSPAAKTVASLAAQAMALLSSSLMTFNAARRPSSRLITLQSDRAVSSVICAYLRKVWP